MKKLAENPLFVFFSGLILTAVVYFVSIFMGHHWQLNSSIVEDSVLNHGTMLVLSILLILTFKKQVNYRIAMPKVNQILKPILFGILCAVVINVVMNIISVIVTGSIQTHPLMKNTTFLKNFLSVFILASIGEEFLFRGFFQNYLKPLGARGFKIFKRRISLPVLISALTFSAAHLVLLASGVDTMFIIRVLVFTFVLGLIAGYYQEKHDNHIFAIFVHMAGNLMGLVSVIMMTMSFNVQNKPAGETFDLTKHGAHYVFTASINGTADATILVESGIPALLADSAYVFNNGIFSDLTLTPTSGKEKIDLGGRVYKITHKANGTVRIGKSTSFNGDVFVLSNYDYGNYEMAVPVMYLHNDLDRGSRIVNLNLGNQRMQMLSRKALITKKASYSKSTMNTDTYMNMFAVETSATLDDGIKPRTLSGNFLIDFGNPELLFLIEQTNEVQQFLADNADLELHEAVAPNGQVVGQYIITEQCQLGGITFPDAVVVITKNLPLITTPGNIGLKFFEKTDAVFDFDQSVVYTK